MEMGVAEVARTLLNGRLAGALRCDGSGEALAVCHATDCTGRPMVLVRDGDDLARALLWRTAAGDPLAVLTVPDDPPVLGAPSRGRASVAGRLRRVPDPELRTARIEFAEANPVPALFDVGAGAALYRIDIEEIRLHAPGEHHLIDADDYIAADPDPLHVVERDILLDLADHHSPEMEGYFRAMLAAAGIGCPQPPRAVRLDRYGFVVHVGGPDPTIRLEFPVPVRDEQDLAHLLHPVLFHGSLHGAE
ncbi:DUF2470 domain-containing protein [Pilimelia anulata]|nr:DUF2470 domain-containing protein [Pilimelia anulata]